jgi:hypothetical protein
MTKWMDGAGTLDIVESSHSTTTSAVCAGVAAAIIA